MRRKLGLMISPSSLAAFSASVVPSLPSAQTGPVGRAGVRLAAAERPAAPPVAAAGAGLATAPPPGRVLPRGSLLDLRV